MARTEACDLHAVNLAEYELLALYSPSDVRAVVSKFGTENLPTVAVFGEGTLRAALDAGITVRANAPTPQAPSMVKAVDLYLEKVRKGEEVAPVALTVDARKEEFLRTQEHKMAKRSVRKPADTQKPANTTKTAAAASRK